MSLKSETLLNELIELTQKNIDAAELFKNYTTEQLNWKENTESWSILECVEHLNRYSDFYLPEISQKIRNSKSIPSEIFKSNWFGRYFSKSVSYKEKLNKMKTFASMNPINSELSISTIDKFIIQQHEVLELLDKAKNVNLDKTKTAISISKLIKLKLGDTLRVLIYHNERHIKQAENVLELV
ncbi:hypothetical protein BTO06_17410 [Tenacibaculum sp. SZ-18]|uniref:DinB family protein n=1 Tax=Tenacibaculum sp. SZ-18 TaxID=754423 RepID=UPI000C2CE35C|nr:DinB family protein [Tenacibaculum sp. SZ-18]AUC16811.1 hypothetical protein BTO06_17410 [Tenacibaculum sp. SZ-18]